MDEVRAALFSNLRSSSKVETFQPEVLLKTGAVRERFRVFQNDCDLESGSDPLEDAVIFMSVQTIIDKSTEYSVALTKDVKIELRWQKVSHYIWFVTGLELKHLCVLALRVLKYLIAQSSIHICPSSHNDKTLIQLPLEAETRVRDISPVDYPRITAHSSKEDASITSHVGEEIVDTAREAIDCKINSVSEEMQEKALESLIRGFDKKTHSIHRRTFHKCNLSSIDQIQDIAQQLYIEQSSRILDSHRTPGSYLSRKFRSATEFAPQTGSKKLPISETLEQEDSPSSVEEVEENDVWIARQLQPPAKSRFQKGSRHDSRKRKFSSFVIPYTALSEIASHPLDYTCRSKRVQSGVPEATQTPTLDLSDGHTNYDVGEDMMLDSVVENPEAKLSMDHSMTSTDEEESDFEVVEPDDDGDGDYTDGDDDRDITKEDDPDRIRTRSRNTTPQKLSGNLPYRAPKSLNALSGAESTNISPISRKSPRASHITSKSSSLPPAVTEKTQEVGKEVVQSNEDKGNDGSESTPDTSSNYTICWMTANMPLEGMSIQPVRPGFACEMCKERRRRGMESSCFYFDTTRDGRKSVQFYGRIYDE
ncbi:hypothetical protein GLAREA_11752 [Glarea lozoyensis ATCC 20868]|uniref:Uncharacterized protein n=1 Tax=Glarea lozoyensis (strain ATCC 20868 / MF5171) TaxID=1116229 RepID=S3CZA8_GLAL2|nr:uncharacterized protein GLAREA_11752 [Glarea lozoyensis ATCC 20868]EPE25171.1 hypothetical protein GLAREA_11752 [Glarea lozoyensis ATCC 20868]